MTTSGISDYNRQYFKKKQNLKCSDREEYLAAQSKERRWLVRISVSVPAEVALEQWTEQKKRTAMFSK